MVSAKTVGIVFLLVGVWLAGCASVGPQQTAQTPASTTDGDSSVTKTTVTTERGTIETPACSVGEVEYDVAVPEAPDVLDETAAERIAVDYEKRYQRVRHESIYDLSSYESSLASVKVEAVDEGFEVTVQVRVDAQTSDGDQLSGGYPYTYHVSEDGVVRDGTTLTCWTDDD